MTRSGAVTHWRRRLFWWVRALSLAVCVGPLVVLAAPVGAAPVIGAIRFEGNRVTRDVVLRQQLLIRVGEPLMPSAVETSRQAIMNLGLFVRVQDRVSPMPDGRVAVIFTVKEKTYTWVLPRLGRTADGDISYGGQLEFDNVFGLDQRLKLIAEQKQIAGGGTSDQQSVEYAAARLPGSAYGFSAKLGATEQRELLYAPDGAEGVYRNRVSTLNVSLTRWLNRDGLNSGWSTGLGLGVSEIGYRYLSGRPGLAASGREVGVNTNIGYTRVRLGRYGYRQGVEYGLSLGAGGRLIGSHYSQLGVGGYYRRYRRSEGGAENLNYQLRFGFSSRTSSLGPAYTLGGADTLRGYVRDSLEGNAYVLANVEYLHPMFGRPLLRGVLFTDLGNAWYRGDSAPWRLDPAFGVGVRWHIDWLVNVDLRVDMAYAVGQRRYQVYAGSRSMF
ncbi:hypothetical protein BI364_02430 [Acidihalobacter yilgarnensis]|uniref:POTRA domain-containing protein n=1 Tax=Acidihalobacter yilgarnensis TaxID=2819280 RepID=A0A1D8IKU7_9GAMM|nr:POTRA domain-containing protein [Acidihalobacter yilgarnensis]AOU97011.1 hypothetical protein BI364_02430 [Acidihalobacter yilgarnensis]